MRIKTAFVRLLLAALPLAPIAALADDVEDAQAVIESQIAAFLNDDAESAYFHAAPEIQTMFIDKDRFFEMVQNSYAPVYRPDNFAFGRSRAMDGDRIAQEVLIAGPDGDDWTALYILKKQEDGAFKINGVQMVKSAAPQT
ncbi:DUF4864 domain-containing protein [Rhizobium sp. EC-SD404]|uniref:DUF4864 domain-containing protein n=1 Tax=Rhizobium sp. EC-SD404 TaxID=2038389 RepID=UPI001259963E|nr:DUF4864 domain-containing protein [Rhizobium sp. EC-SD404]VVT19058.1 conserved exported hypothetical protein [Rhizobium sp. EC-SD404]